MADLFQKNTFVRGFGWFGPDYPGSEVTSEVEAAVTAARGAGGGGAGTGADKGASAPVTAQQGPSGVDGQGSGTDAVGDVTGDAGSAAGDTTAAPPRSGAGASRSAWADYAQAQGVDIEDGASRDDIIAAVDRAAE